jgi:hypothetical protein
VIFLCPDSRGPQGVSIVEGYCPVCLQGSLLALNLHRASSKSRTSRQPHASSSLEEKLYTIRFTIMKPATLRPFLPRIIVKRRIYLCRGYAVQAPGSPTLQIFNRHTKRLQKERAAADVARSRQTDYLKDEMATRLSERLLVSFHTPIEFQS